MDWGSGAGGDGFNDWGSAGAATNNDNWNGPGTEDAGFSGSDTGTDVQKAVSGCYNCGEEG
jgi:hypothetical protein